VLDRHHDRCEPPMKLFADGVEADGPFRGIGADDDA
jgi:hypothetical protein